MIAVWVVCNVRGESLATFAYRDKAGADAYLAANMAGGYLTKAVYINLQKQEQSNDRFTEQSNDHDNGRSNNRTIDSLRGLSVVWS